MSFVGGIKRELRFLAGPASVNTLAKLDRWVMTGLLDQLSAAGIEVNEETAQKLTAFYRAVEIISQTVGMLPLKVKKITGPDVKEDARDHHLWKLLHDMPNEVQTAMDYREMLQGHLCIRNNAVAIIERNNRTGRVDRLVPIHPDRVGLERRKDNSLVYTIVFPDGPKIFPMESIHHIRGRSRDGLWGQNRLWYASDAIGRGLAVQEHSSKFFANSAMPGGVLKTAKRLTDDGRKRLKRQWEEGHGGSHKAYKVAVLEEDMNWEQIGISPEQAQLIASADFSVADVSRITGVPLHMLARPDAQAFKSVEVVSIEFVIYGLLPWIKRWEQSITRDLVPEEERSTISVEFTVKGLLRGDQKSRFEAYRIARQWGWMSANDVLRLEGENNIGPQGDIYLVPMNMVPADMLEEVVDSTIDSGGDEIVNPNAAPDNPEPPRFKKFHEKRTKQSRLTNRRIHRPMFEDAFKRIVVRETNALRQQAEKHLKDRQVVDFREAMLLFYRDFPSQIEQILRPVYNTYSLALEELVANEIGPAVGDEILGVEENVRRYTQDVAKRYKAVSASQLESILRNTEGNVGEVILQRLEEWRARRAGKESARELVDAETELINPSYSQRGVNKLRWRTVGENCPLCDSMEGTVVGVADNFLDSGDVIDPGVEGTAPLQTKRAIRGPQLHQGCNCMVVAETGF